MVCFEVESRGKISPTTVWGIFTVGFVWAFCFSNAMFRAINISVSAAPQFIIFVPFPLRFSSWHLNFHIKSKKRMNLCSAHSSGYHYEMQRDLNPHFQRTTQYESDLTYTFFWSLFYYFIYSCGRFPRLRRKSLLTNWPPDHSSTTFYKHCELNILHSMILFDSKLSLNPGQT